MTDNEVACIVGKAAIACRKAEIEFAYACGWLKQFLSNATKVGDILQSFACDTLSAFEAQRLLREISPFPNIDELKEIISRRSLCQVELDAARRHLNSLL